MFVTTSGCRWQTYNIAESHQHPGCYIPKNHQNMDFVANILKLTHKVTNIRLSPTSLWFSLWLKLRWCWWHEIMTSKVLVKNRICRQHLRHVSDCHLVTWCHQLIPPQKPSPTSILSLMSHRFFNSRYSKFEFGACLLASGRLCLSLRLRSSQSYFHLPNSFFSIRAIWLASRLSRPKTFFPVRKKKYWILFFLEKTKNFKIFKRFEKYVLAWIWRSSGATVAKVRMHFEFYCIFMHLNENNKLYAVNHIFMVRLKTLLYNVIQTVCKVSLLLPDIFSFSNSEWVLSWPQGAHVWPHLTLAESDVVWSYVKVLRYLLLVSCLLFDFIRN